MPNTREKLIELLGGNTCKHDTCEECEYGENRDACIAYLKESMADYLIANGVTVQQWISVKDRLPKSIANKVIVRCENDYIGFGHYQDYKGKQTWYNLENDRPFTDWNHDDCDSYEVTHWMPLPRATKE